MCGWVGGWVGGCVCARTRARVCVSKKMQCARLDIQFSRPALKGLSENNGGREERGK